MTQTLPALMPITDLEKMAVAFAKSGMFGAKTPEQALALLLLAQAEGTHPAIAMRDFDVIQGRPAKKAEAMLRSFIANGGKVEWHEMTDNKADATFSHPQGGSIRIDWDMARAKKAGVDKKDNYTKYTRQMLANRVISEGCRRIYPASTSGLYVPDEVIQFKEKDITPTAGALGALPSKDRDVVSETADQVIALLANDQAADAYALWQNSKFDADHEVAFWSLIPDSNARALLKDMQAREYAQEKGVISPAKHKRLEALIKEHKLDRQGLKDWIMGQFSKEHFTELTNDEYEKLDDHIATITASPRHDSPSQSADISPADDGAVATYISDVELMAIESVVEMKGIKGRFDTKLAASGIKSPDKIPASKVASIKAWVEASK